MATAARLVIAEVEEIVQPGELIPDEVHTPSVYVDRIVLTSYPKRIERRVNRNSDSA
jgi:3-oxoacid CoA-transferase subunit A